MTRRNVTSQHTCLGFELRQCTSSHIAYAFYICKLNELAANIGRAHVTCINDRGKKSDITCYNQHPTRVYQDSYSFRLHVRMGSILALTECLLCSRYNHQRATIRATLHDYLPGYRDTNHQCVKSWKILPAYHAWGAPSPTSPSKPRHSLPSW